MTRRYKKSEIRLSREFAKDIVDDFVSCHLLGLNKLELEMVKNECDIQITKLLIEISERNTEKKI